MPQKRNHAGNMQNYVPAGNGDASGEYGDNATGSNVHFKTFKKPETNGGETTSTTSQVQTNQQIVNETPKEKKETRWNELSKKQKKEIGMYVYSHRNMYDDNRFINNMRYYSGSFGDLSNYTDDELKDIINEIKDFEQFDSFDKSDLLYFKEGGKWKMTRYPKELMDKLGIEALTKSERDAKEIEDATKTLNVSQTTQDKEIKNIMGENCEVCFGKGYSKEDLNQIVQDTKTITNDFSLLKGYVENIGDRNNLEKLLNAKISTRELSDDIIQKEVDKLKRYVDYPNLTDEAKELRYRAEAIERLKQPIKITQLNNAYAYWSGGTKSLVFMGKMKKLEDSQKDYEYETNFKSSNKRNATYTHEMGHAVDSAINDLYSNKYKESSTLGSYEKHRELAIKKQEYDTKINELYSQNLNKEYKEKFNEIFKGKYGRDYDERSYDRTKYDAVNYTKEELKKMGIKKYSLSEYGNTNKKEFIAESFSAYYTGMNNPLANEVVKTMKEFYSYLNNF